MIYFVKPSRDGDFLMCEARMNLAAPEKVLGRVGVFLLLVACFLEQLFPESAKFVGLAASHGALMRWPRSTAPGLALGLVTRTL